MSLYTSSLKKAWKITIKHKYLWVFGIFAGIFNLFETTQFVQKSTLANNLNTYAQFFAFLNPLNAINFLAEKPTEFFLNTIIFLAMLSIGLILIWLAIVSQVAIIHAANTLDKRIKVNFRKAFELGKKNFLSVFTMNLGSKILISILALILTLPIILFDTYGRGISSTIPDVISIFLMLALILASTIVYFGVVYAIAYHVLQNKSIKESIKEGVHLFKKNWLISIEMALLLAVLTFIVSKVGTLILSILSTYLFVLFLTPELGLMAYIIAIVLTILLVCSIFIISGAFAVFQLSAWIILFKKLDEQEHVSHIQKFIHGIKNVFSK